VKDLDKLEELFRENLSGFESDPGAGVWENIAQKLPTQNAAAGSTAAVAKSSLLKLVAGGLIAVTGITLAVVFFTTGSEEKKGNNKEAEKEENKQITTNNLTDENSVVEKTEVISEETDLQQKDIIVKDEKKNKTMIVTVKENPKFNMNKSSVDGWITKRNNYNSSTANSNAIASNAAIISTDTKTEQPATFELKEVNEAKPIASIKRSISGGPAPLTITFSNAVEEKHYEWTVEGETINESTFTHTFENPGYFHVKLTVKDAKGNKSTDMVEVNVGEPLKTEPEFISKVSRGINVFTPNGDGENDYFYFNCENIESFVLQVTDMEGKQIYFETTDPYFKWDGTTLNGDKIADGTYIYFYKATGKDKREYANGNSLTIKTKR